MVSLHIANVSDFAIFASCFQCSVNELCSNNRVVTMCRCWHVWKILVSSVKCVIHINICIIRPHHPYDVCRCGLLLPTESRGLLVWRSVTLVRPAKIAEPIEMPFRLRTPVGPGNHVLDGVQIPPWEWAILRGKGASHCKV